MTLPALRKDRLVGLVVVVFWLVMMALLWRRERVTPEVTGDPTTAPSESWLVLSVAERRSGYLHLHQEPASRRGRPGVRSTLEGVLSLSLLGKPTRMEMEGRLWRSLAEPEAELEATIRSGGQELRIEGEVADGTLAARLHSAGEVIPLRVPVDPAVLQGGWGASLRLPRLAPGETTTVGSVDPFTLGPGEVTVRARKEEELTVAGELRRARVLELEGSGVSATAWVDAEDGVLLRLVTPFGLELTRVTAREALAAALSEPGDELLSRTAVRPAGERPFRGARRMEVVVRGGPPELPEEPGQRRTGDGGWVVEALPPTEERLIGVEDWLAPDPLIQSDHPRIREQAAAVVGDEEDPWKRAVLLHDWVHETLQKEPVLSLPSALEVLEDRRGDCNEHTVLFVALARAAGIPARIGIGVVWSEEGEGFYYHAWPEVGVGRWVRMDPTLGQRVADATHLELVQGGIEEWPRLVPWLGRLEIEVREVE